MPFLVPKWKGPYGDPPTPHLGFDPKWSVEFSKLTHSFLPENTLFLPVSAGFRKMSEKKSKKFQKKSRKKYKKIKGEKSKFSLK